MPSRRTTRASKAKLADELLSPLPSAAPSTPLPVSQNRAKRLNPSSKETPLKLVDNPRQPLQPLEANSIALANSDAQSKLDSMFKSNVQSVADRARDQLTTLYARYPELKANPPEEDDDLDEKEAYASPILSKRLPHCQSQSHSEDPDTPTLV
ncbi:hypothetical protein FNAPI_13538 [Fusarium napiforme]|uniref:Uncharacterized protein n=1 Tax=Fusarium napiforme TaxID=42672 RepID=A0A8H5I6P9_9HYPO|nr:hypothetical protein FNAPI_13538 [Fusarium napiforme]